MKKFCCLLLVLCMVLGAVLLPSFAEEKKEEKPAVPEIKLHAYEDEVQAHVFRPHGGDKREIADFAKAILENLKDEEKLNALLAKDTAHTEKIKAYLTKLAAFEKVEIVSTAVDKLYTVKDFDEYTNHRAIAKIKMLCHTTDKKVLEVVDYWNVAKLDKEAPYWRLWHILWQDAGVDVTAVPEITQLDMPKEGEEICIMVTEAGVIQMRLFPEEAPLTVKNFIALAKEGFYDNKPFPRVYENFMIQSYPLDGTSEIEYSSYGKKFKDEFSRKLYNFRGALCSGNHGPSTNSCQFYIVQMPTVNPEHLELAANPINIEAKYKEVGGLPYLDNRYTVFGQVFKGIEVVDKIAKQKADDDGMPVKDPVKILSIKFIKYVK